MRAHNNTLVCLCCGGGMQGRRPDALWCSTACRVKGNRIMAQGAAAGEPYGTTAELLHLGVSIGAAPASRGKGHQVKGGGGASKVSAPSGVKVSGKSAAAVARSKAKRAAKAAERRRLHGRGGS